MIDSPHSPDRHYLHIQKAKYQSEITEGPKNPALFNILKKKIISLVKKYHPETSLLVDVGGFNGQITDTLNALVLDISETILAQAACKNIPVICADMHHLPFRRDSLKSVLLCHALEHSPAPMDILKSIHNVLTKDGYLFLVLPNAASSGQFFKLLLHGQVRPSGNPPLSPIIHFHQYTVKNVQPLLQAAGFNIITLTGDNVYIPFAQKLGLLNIMRYLGNMLPALSESILLAAQKQPSFTLSNEDIKKIKKKEIQIRDTDVSFENYTVQKKTPWFNKIELRNAFAMLTPEGEQRILDAGCGAGRFLKYLQTQEKGALSATGIDYSFTNLTTFKKDETNPDLVCGDICSLPFCGNTFDKIYALQVLTCIPSREERIKFMRELSCVLKKKARILLTVLNYSFWGPRHPACKKEGFFPKGLYFYNYDPGELKAELEECDFNVVTMTGSNILPVTYLRRLRTLGLWCDTFLTKYFHVFCLKKAQYILVVAEKNDPRSESA